jgi:hypothetical protein
MAQLARLDWLLVLVLAAVPRLTALSKYLIIDEPGRWEWAKQFFTAVVTGNFAGTAIHGYPGIMPDWFTFIWIGLNALWRSLQRGSWLDDAGLYNLLHEWGRIPDHLADQRLGVVVANTLLVVLAYLLLRRLFGRRLALVSSILIALNPFYLTDARVNRAEGVTAGIIFVSLLLFLLYLREERWRWFLLSGAAAGMACLTKIQALVIVPIMGLIGLIYWLSLPGRRTFWQRMAPWVGSMAAWGMVVVITFWIAWPAMWVQPVETLSMVYDYATEQSGEEGVNLFFLGQVVRDDDPGPLFYPVAFLLRTTPFVLLGLGAALVAWRRQRRHGEESPPLWPLTLFSVVYPLIMTLGSHKQDRYLLTILPTVDVLAAAGLLWLWQRALNLSIRERMQREVVGLGLLVLASALFILPYHPYYYPYFNPLLGGSYTAPHLIRIGWGEGLDQVADFLNTQPAPRQMKVATRFPKHLLGYEGQLVPLDALGEWTRADYIVFYIHQLQRQQDPGPGEIRWLQQYPPEHEVHLAGIPYASVYRNPLTAPADPTLSQVPGMMQLFGYIWDTDTSMSGSPLRLVWLNKADTAGQVVVQWRSGDAASGWFVCKPATGFEAANQTAGEVVESTCPLPPASFQSPGLYDLEVGWQQGDSVEGPLPFPEGEASVLVREDGALSHLPLHESMAYMAADALPQTAVPLDAIYGRRLRLVGYEVVPPKATPGTTVEITLFWQSAALMEEDYTSYIQVFASGEDRVADAYMSHETSQWQLGSVHSETYQLSLPEDMSAPLLLRLDVGLQDDAMHLLRPADRDGQPLPWTIATLKVVPVKWPTLAQAEPVSAQFQAEGALIRLAGSTLTPEAAEGGVELTLTLYWQPEGTPTEDYTVFVQMLDSSSQVVAQGDSPPRGGVYPTSWWASGETVADTHTIPLPADLAPGSYRLVVGLYRLSDGARVPVSAETAIGPDALLLTNVEID